MAVLCACFVPGKLFLSLLSKFSNAAIVKDDVLNWQGKGTLSTAPENGVFCHI